MASTFWALDAARRRRKDPVPGTSKWVANELYTVNSNVLSSSEKFAHGMSEDYDMLNGFMKSAMNGNAIRDYVMIHSSTSSSNLPKEWSEKSERIVDWKEEGEGLLKEEREKENDHLSTIFHRQPEFSSVIHLQQIPVPEPYSAPAAVSSPVEAAINYPSSVKDGSPKLSFSKIEPHTIFQTNSPIRPNTIETEAEANNNQDMDDSFQKIKTAIRKSIARTPGGNSKKINVNMNSATGAQPLLLSIPQAVFQSVGSSVQEGSPRNRKSGFVPLPTREPLSSIVNREKRELSDSIKRKSSMHFKVDESKKESIRPQNLIPNELTHTNVTVPVTVPVLSRGSRRASRILSVIESLQDRKSSSENSRRGTLPRKQGENHIGNASKASDLIFKSETETHFKSSANNETNVKNENDMQNNDKNNNNDNDVSNSTPKKKDQYIGFTGSVLRRARNLFLSEPPSSAYSKQDKSSTTILKKSDIPELELPRPSLKSQIPSISRSRSRSRSRSPTRTIQIKTPRSPIRTSPTKKVQKLDYSPDGTPQKPKEVFKQTDLINRLMAPTSSSAAKTSKPKLPELKKVDLGVKNKLLTATLNPTKPPKFSPNKNRYGTLRQQVSNRPIQSPIKRIDKILNDAHPEEPKLDPTTRDRNLDKERERERDRERGRLFKPKQKIMIAVNHKLDTSLPPLKASLYKSDFEHNEVEEESKRRKTDKYSSRSTATTPARKSKYSEKSRISSGVNNPYKTPGKSNKSLLAPSELPEILTDEEDDREKRIFENWAETPQLKRVLLQQQKINPDSIFGEIPPLDIEDIFESQASRQRGRASLSNWSPEAK